MRERAGSRVKAQDALFLHVHSPSAPQQVGAVVTVTGCGVSLAALRSAVAARVSEVPQLRRRLMAARGRWPAARWVTDDAVDVCSRIKQVRAGADGWPDSTEQVAARFFAEPIDPCWTPWQILLLGDRHDGGSTLIVKVHHALGDSYTLISALSGLFDPGTRRQPGRRRYATPVSTPRVPLLRATASQLVCTVRGAVALALTSPAPRIRGHRRSIGGGRSFATIKLPSRAFRITARRLRTNPTALVLALVAEALGELMTRRGQLTGGRHVRVLAPLTARKGMISPRRAGGSGAALAHASQREPPSNQASGLLLDLPLEPMTLAERVTAIQRMWAARLRRGDAQAAALILRAMNLLPAPLQRAVARMSYCGRRFNMIVSVFPGIRRRHFLLGAEVSEVYPVLALADGAALAIGAMTWRGSLCLGLLADEQLIPGLPALATAIKRSFAAHQAVLPAERAGRVASRGHRVH